MQSSTIIYGSCIQGRFYVWKRSIISVICEAIFFKFDTRILEKVRRFVMSTSFLLHFRFNRKCN